MSRGTTYKRYGIDRVIAFNTPIGCGGKVEFSSDEKCSSKGNQCLKCRTILFLRDEVNGSNEKLRAYKKRIAKVFEIDYE